MRTHKEDINHDFLLIRDRFKDSKYLIDTPTYHHIMDLIHFYHQSTYDFPDEDRVHVLKFDENNNQSKCDVPINRLIFKS